ncbi:MAG TPA: cyclic nucleotide-binding and patatin-like phospholipase domain-containing protein, partial [Vicinamibacteria bacterium]
MVAGAESGLFAGLTAAEQEAVQERLRARRYLPGAILLQQGQLSGELHIVRSGAVSVSTGDSLGHADELARLGPGQIVGEMSLLTGQPHSATVTAISPTETYVLARDDFLALVANSARLAQNISRTLSERLVRTSRRQVETDRAVVVAVASPCAPAAAPVLALNLAVGLARQSRRRVLLAVDDATLDGPLRPLRGAALPALDEVARDPAAAAAHRAAAPGHPALAGVQLCRLGAAVPPAGAGRAAGPLDPLADVYGYIVLGPAYDTGGAGEARPGWAAGAARALVAAPAERLGQACTVRAVERLQGAGARADLVATDLPRQPSVGELAALGAPAGARVLRGLPVALGALADEPLPPLVRRDRRGAAAAAIDWLARDVAGLKVGLALGAGSARGFAHVGVLRVLEREGVPVDALAGSSIGAVVAAFWACGLPADAVGQALHAAGRGLLRVTVPYASLFSNRNMRLGIRRVVGSRLIEDLPDPFAAV